MPGSFTYDVISFLRVLYRQRWFIAGGAIASTLLVAAISLVWPETWRAQAQVLVTTPQYKEELNLVARPFDVLAYRSLLLQDALLNDTLGTLQWMKRAVDDLSSQNMLDQLKNYHGERGPSMRPAELIENTRPEELLRILHDGDPPDEVPASLEIMAQLGEREIQSLIDIQPRVIEKLTVFDLRKRLSASVEIVKETNLETLYSPHIQVAAEFSTPVGAKLLANLWLELFQRRAETIIRNGIYREIAFVNSYANRLDSDLDDLNQQVADYLNQTGLQERKAVTSSLYVLLTGMSPARPIPPMPNESTNSTEGVQAPILERATEPDEFIFTLTPQYARALLPERERLQRDVNALRGRIQTAEEPDPLRSRLIEKQFELENLDEQIERIQGTLGELLTQARLSEVIYKNLTRERQSLRNSLNQIEPLLAEAGLLASRDQSQRYADISITPAIAPDKRVFPRRSLMTIAGLVVSLALFSGLAFFRDIWDEVVAPESTELSSPPDMDAMA